VKLFEIEYLVNGKDLIKTEVWAKSKNKINTYRLSGFQGDSIDIQKCNYIRDILPIEIYDIDIEKNDLSVLINLQDHLDNSLNHDISFENECLKCAEDLDLELDEYLESIGYIERSHDNSYNYCSDFNNDIDFKIYTLDDDLEYIYSDSAIVLVKEHHGIDARCGYSFNGLYRTLDHDGLCYFFDFHVRLSVDDIDYDGDCAVYSILKDFTLVSNSIEGELIVKDINGVQHSVNMYHPALGV
jgi:hypothetical protein